MSQFCLRIASNYLIIFRFLEEQVMLFWSSLVSKCNLSNPLEGIFAGNPGNCPYQEHADM